MTVLELVSQLIMMDDIPTREVRVQLTTEHFTDWPVVNIVKRADVIVIIGDNNQP